MPTYASFEPHFKALNIGGQHFDSMQQRDSQGMFPDADESGWDAEKRNRQILSEEIQGLLVEKWPGQTAVEKKAKSDALLAVFGTHSWTKISEATKSDDLRFGLHNLREYLSKPAEVEQ